MKTTRLNRGWTQQEAADSLGVTQAYLSMLEEGRRNPSPRLARKLMHVYDLPPTVLPVSDVRENVTADFLAHGLASLGYPGFAHFRARTRASNPAEFLLTAVAQHNLEARVAEGLPWVVLRYSDMDFGWLVPQARMKNLQNRVGFTVTLARLASRNDALQAPEEMLADSKLEKEDSFCKDLSEPERRWLREHRSDEARRWNLLSDLRPDALRYVA
ncbi:MAG: helix-turn-helix transcriptional regulator [Candidatus Acidiferrales bacterium]